MNTYQFQIEKYENLPDLIPYTKPTQFQQINQNKKSLQFNNPNVINKNPKKIFQGKQINKSNNRFNSPSKEERIKSKDIKQIKYKKQKNLIQQLSFRLSNKFVTRQLIDVSSDNINKLVHDLESQKNILLQKIKKIENSHLYNSNKQSCDQKISLIQQKIDSIQIIKLLYLDKIYLRQQIHKYQNLIEKLQNQNQQIRKKIVLGINHIQTKIHALPNQKQKKLAKQIEYLKSQVQKQHQMRVALENKIKSEILNFERFNEEAQSARLIIIKQLKQIQTKQNRLNEIESPVSVQLGIQKINNFTIRDKKIKDLQIEVNPQDKYIDKKYGVKVDNLKESNNQYSPISKQFVRKFDEKSKYKNSSYLQKYAQSTKNKVASNIFNTLFQKKNQSNQIH